MAALSLEEAIESASESFPSIDYLKDEQKKCIAALLPKKDALGSLPTGFGKSLIFQLYLRIFELVNGRENCHVIIVSALNAITEEQVQEIADIGIPAVAVGDSRETDENVPKVEYKLAFGSAQMWLRKTWINNFKKSALRNNVELIVVDETHVAQSWNSFTCLDGHCGTEKLL
ncbi:putative ATP-dependent DNA helicase Q1 isoform X2 [Acropora muricata]|uniref:putative ATP-dependent DNA helicase Q1 isoform X2 n=1 Tax=Acropora muricata TaxID=159855 RepID=UPI0034E41BFC